jgi:hypothetical protein
LLTPRRASLKEYNIPSIVAGDADEYLFAALILTSAILLKGWLVFGLGQCWVMETTPPPLAALLDEINRALHTKLYHSALAVALSVPDVCASLEFDPAAPSWSTKATYEAWFNANLAGRFSNFSAADCYRLRGGVLHRAHFRHPKARYDRIIFLLPGSPIHAHDVVCTIAPDVVIGGMTRAEITGRDKTGEILYLDIVRFCDQIANAAREWAGNNQNNVNVQAN